MHYSRATAMKFLPNLRHRVARLSLAILTCGIIASGLAFQTCEAAPPTPKLLYVQVRRSTLRAEPKFWAPVVSELPYGSPLTPLQAASEDTSWIKAKFGEVEGFVHRNVVTSRKVVFSSSNKQQGAAADPSSVVLAGKGFNSQVEGSYASAKGIDFSAVDEVEGYKVDDALFLAFLRDGKLLSQ